jgi:hypothetical protein
MHYLVRVQTLVISSKKVGWKKQGSCTLVDDEPKPPEQKDYASSQGWKEVKGITVAAGGGNFLIPKDQLLLVGTDGSYKPIQLDSKRTLAKLSSDKHYLVWYHHLFPSKVWKEKWDNRDK